MLASKNVVVFSKLEEGKFLMFRRFNLMNILRGQRGKLDVQFNLDLAITIKMQTYGAAVYDYSCFGVDEAEQLSDDRYMVFYNQPQTPQREVSYQMVGNQAVFSALLNRLPQTIQKLVFTVSIDGNGTMGQISGFEVSISQNGCEPIILHLNGNDFSQEKAIISLEIYQKNGWRYSAVARGFNGGLSDLLHTYGGEEEQEDTSQKQLVQASVIQQKSPPLQSTMSPLVQQQEKVELLKIGDHPVNLKKNEKVELRKYNDEILEKVVVGLGWDAAKIGVNIDCDSSVFLCRNGKLHSNSDIVAFYNLKHKSGAVKHKGDNLTGHGDGDDEQIVIDLKKVPQKYDRIVIVVNIFFSKIRRQHFGKIKNCYMRLCDHKGKELCRYTLSKNSEYDKKTAMIFGELIKQNDIWIFHAIGQGTNDNSISKLASRFK